MSSAYSAQDEFARVNEQCREVSGGVKERSRILARVTEELESVKQEMDERGSSMTDGSKSPKICFLHYSHVSVSGDTSVVRNSVPCALIIELKVVLHTPLFTMKLVSQFKKQIFQAIFRRESAVQPILQPESRLKLVKGKVKKMFRSYR